MRRILPVLLLLAVTAPVLAAEPGAKGGEKGDPKGGAPGTNIDMPYLMAPMMGADGKLAGYAYISSKVTANNEAGANDVRDKIAFIQDAFVRDVNGTSIGKPDDRTQVNMPGLQARLLADARKIMGGKIASLAIVTVQIAPLHPQQSPGALPPADSTQSAAPTAPAAPAKAP